MKNLENLKVMEKAITLDGTIIRISIENIEFKNNCWTVNYNNKTFEYHGNIWMEVSNK